MCLRGTWLGDERAVNLFLFVLWDIDSEKLPRQADCMQTHNSFYHCHHSSLCSHPSFIDTVDLSRIKSHRASFIFDATGTLCAERLSEVFKGSFLAAFAADGSDLCPAAVEEPGGGCLDVRREEPPDERKALHRPCICLL